MRDTDDLLDSIYLALTTKGWPDRDAGLVLIHTAQAEAYAEGFEAGQIAMRERAEFAANTWRHDEPTHTRPFLPNYGQARVDAGKCVAALPIEDAPIEGVE